MAGDKNEYILSINGMSKSFGRNKVLKHISLNVKPGSIMGLMGENGAGKSTMMKCLFGTYQKDEGTIILDGKEVNFSGPKDALENANYQKSSKKAGKRKEEKSPLLDCLGKEDVSERKEFTVHKRVCGNCADVCPNRANVLIEVPEMELLQIIHVDYMCNECGNCRSFCQYAGAPYKDKFTLFANEEDMKDSINNGFTVLDAKNKEIKIRIGEKEEVVRADQPSGILNKGLSQLICTVIDQYAYLLM